MSAGNSEPLVALFVMRTAMKHREYKNNENTITQNKMPPLWGILSHPVLKNPEVFQFR